MFDNLGNVWGIRQQIYDTDMINVIRSYRNVGFISSCILPNRLYILIFIAPFPLVDCGNVCVCAIELKGFVHRTLVMSLDFDFW